MTGGAVDRLASGLLDEATAGVLSLDGPGLVGRAFVGRTGAVTAGGLTFADPVAAILFGGMTFSCTDAFEVDALLPVEGAVAAFAFISTSFPLPLLAFEPRGIALVAVAAAFASLALKNELALSFSAASLFADLFLPLPFTNGGSPLLARSSFSCWRRSARRSAFVNSDPAAGGLAAFFGCFEGLAGVEEEVSSSAFRLLSSFATCLPFSVFCKAGLSKADESWVFEGAKTTGTVDMEGPDTEMVTGFGSNSCRGVIIDSSGIVRAA